MQKYGRTDGPGTEVAGDEVTSGSRRRIKALGELSVTAASGNERRNSDSVSSMAERETELSRSDAGACREMVREAAAAWRKNAN